MSWYWKDDITIFMMESVYERERMPVCVCVTQQLTIACFGDDADAISMLLGKNWQQNPL